MANRTTQKEIEPYRKKYGKISAHELKRKIKGNLRLSKKFPCYAGSILWRIPTATARNMPQAAKADQKRWRQTSKRQETRHLFSGWNPRWKMILFLPVQALNQLRRTARPADRTDACNIPEKKEQNPKQGNRQ